MRQFRASVFPVMLMAASVSAPENPPPIVSPELFAKALTEGSVRVIVHLRLPLEAGDVRRRAIDTAQRSVLKEILHTSHRVVRKYETVPLLAVEVSADGLRVLAASPNVVGVQEDALAAPQAGPGAGPVKSPK